MPGPKPSPTRATTRRRPVAPDLPATPGPDGLRRLSPTDLSTFVRLDQCERYLRLRLHERLNSLGFMRDRGLRPQELPTLLSRSGNDFEARVEAAIAADLPATHYDQDQTDPEARTHHAALLTLIDALAPGEVRVVFQPRLDVALAGWRVTGDVDVLRLARDADGALHLLIADVKSSASVKVEHRLQIAFYAEMLESLLAEGDRGPARLDLAVIYRGPVADSTHLTPEDRARLAAHRTAAGDWFGPALAAVAYLDLAADPAHYRDALDDLVLKEGSRARRVATAPFAEIPFCLAPKCDGCLYNEFCLTDCDERDDLSRVPHLADGEKRALRRTGIDTVKDLAALKAPPSETGANGQGDRRTLRTVAGNEALVARLAATWPVGPRLDELIYRARRVRQADGDPLDAISRIPSRDYPSLPKCAPDQNANLVTLYLDAQHDYLEDRVYLLGALVVGHEAGEPRPERRRAVVRLAEAPVTSPAAEEALLVDWIDATLRAIVEVAAPDAEGRPRAPIHLVFFDQAEQARLLDALARHAHRIMAATPVYDLLTQLAAFDSPVVTYLDREIRNHTNYPLLCQSLQEVSAFLRFDWTTPADFRRIFRHRVFDARARAGERDDPQARWYARRARFSSQIPLEYAYAAWGDLKRNEEGDGPGVYGAATPDLLRAFQERRLAAMAHIATSLPTNKYTSLVPFALPDLASFASTAATLAHALDEFVILERHAELAAWKATRLQPPERRLLSGLTLSGTYEDAGQEPETVERNRQNLERWERSQAYLDAAREANPETTPELTKEQQKETALKQDGLLIRLRLTTEGADIGLEEALGRTELKQGDYVIVMPRLTTDRRLPPEERERTTPTGRQLLYGMRAILDEITPERDLGPSGRITGATVELVLRESFGVSGDRGFLFSSIAAHPFQEGARYTLDEDPNSIYGYWQSKVTQGLAAGGTNALYARLADPAAPADWPPEAVAGQGRFLAGLEALHETGAFVPLEPGKRRFVGELGEAGTLLVQGPPGTGKSFTTAYAILARVQGAMAAGRDYRVVVSCKTHAATDVLIENVLAARERLRAAAASHPDLFAQFFDARLLDLPIFRHAPHDPPPEGVFRLLKEGERQKGMPKAADQIAANPWCVVGATPGGVYGIVKEKWESKALFGHELVDALVLDEASQMNLPEAIMAALPLRADGHLIVVGDHRQMPPIVKHDWTSEQRRTFRAFRSYESLFLSLLPFAEAGKLPIVRFQESFRLHAELAEFLRREVYQRDGIPFHSRKRATLAIFSAPDDYLTAVLDPNHPLVVVIHDEEGSQQRNPFEQGLIAPILHVLADPTRHGLEPREGIGVVVPHRAQRAALQAAVPGLTIRDEDSGVILRSAVDTVERFQGGERTVIVVGATESERGYLLASAGFLLDPRRLNVALSRAKQKMILVAARSIFDLFSADDETFAHAQIWKNLLRRTCTVPLWQGERDGQRVEVWGNQAMTELGRTTGEMVLSSSPVSARPG